MNTIRLTVNSKVEKTFAILEQHLPSLSRTEILKLGLSSLMQELYNKNAVDIQEYIKKLNATEEDNGSNKVYK